MEISSTFSSNILFWVVIGLWLINNQSYSKYYWCELVYLCKCENMRNRKIPCFSRFSCRLLSYVIFSFRYLVVASKGLVIPANIYLFKVNNKNAGERCEIFWKLTIKTYRCLVFFVYFYQVNVSKVVFKNFYHAIIKVCWWDYGKALWYHVGGNSKNHLALLTNEWILKANGNSEVILICWGN